MLATKGSFALSVPLTAVRAILAIAAPITIFPAAKMQMLWHVSVGPNRTVASSPGATIVYYWLLIVVPAVDGPMG